MGLRLPSIKFISILKYRFPSLKKTTKYELSPPAQRKLDRYNPAPVSVLARLRTLIIFTVTNKTTSQVYVGSTRNDLIDQWEKMVAAAAEQNMDYPLYQEIRIHGRDGFVVEEWDFVEDRNELMQLEQEAIDSLNARSLRGYKTSTVKIQPKKKTRVRKSSLEKELATLLVDSDDEIDAFEDLDIGGKKEKTEQTTTTVQTPVETQPQTNTVKPTSIRLETTTIEQPKPEPVKIAEEAIIRPDTGSQVNAVVQMNDICLSDDISAQLAAITAAANAVLTGEGDAVELLKSKPVVQEVVKEDITEGLAEATAVVEVVEPVKAALEVAAPEVVVELNPRERRIRDAIERHRKVRAQKNTASQTNDRQHLEQLLAELNTRAMGMTNSSIAAVA